VDNYSKSVDNSIKPRFLPVDNSVISWIYETFSDHYVRHIPLPKLHGISSTNPYEWIKTRVFKPLAIWHIGYTVYMKKTYKCPECATTIAINTKVHTLPDSIICPCDAVMPLKP